MIVYKLTDANNRTYGGMSWRPGEWRETIGEGELCAAGWLHAYEHPLLAVLHNPIHGRFDLKTAKLWEAEAGGAIKRDGQMKLGASRMRIVKQIDLPELTLNQIVAYSILCGSQFCNDSKWQEWSWGWLLNVNRTPRAARAAEAEVARGMARGMATWAARAAAAWAAEAEVARGMARGMATWAAAAWAAWAAEAEINLVEIAEIIKKAKSI